jgi:thioredoxin reductase (NADPH)
MTYDVAIIGGGPAGVTAGIYLGRMGRKCVILEAGVVGGQMFLSHEVENYPGFKEPISGSKLSSIFEEQVKRFDVEVKMFPVEGIKKEKNEFILKGMSGEVKAKSVIVATGSIPRKLGLDGEEKLFGKGVSYCSTCDGMFFKNRDVAVIGGGNSSLEGVLHLSRICKSVSLIHRRDEFRGDKVLVDRARNLENVKFYTSFIPEKINGESKVESISLKNLKTKKTEEVKLDAVFIYVGTEAKNSMVKGFLDLDEKGYIKVDKEMKTSVEGVFAAGDIISKKHKQIVLSCAEGCMASYSADEFLINT